MARPAAEVLANIDAMELAVDETAAASAVTVDDLVHIHQALMRRASNAAIAGRVGDVQNWIGGNDYNPCSADFVPPSPEHLAGLLADLSEFCNSDHLPPLILIQAAVAHAQFETIHAFEDGKRPDRPCSHPRSPPPARTRTDLRPARRRRPRRQQGPLHRTD